MYVCICNVLTDRDVTSARDAGARTARDVYRFHGCRPQCGRCLAKVRDTLGRPAGDEGPVLSPAQLLAAE